MIGHPMRALGLWPDRLEAQRTNTVGPKAQRNRNEAGNGRLLGKSVD